MAFKLANGMTVDSVDELQALIDKGLVDVTQLNKHDVFSPSPNTQVPHGWAHDQNIAGLFSRPGTEPEIFGTLVRPQGGDFINALWRGVSLIQSPEYSIITGQYGLDGTTATDFCSDAPTAGFVKLCTTRSQFGRAMWKTKQTQLNTVGGVINRADVNKNYVNARMASPLMPEVIGNPDLNSEVGLQVFMLGNQLEREISQVIWDGANGTASGGFINEFNGFDSLITTGYTDVESGNACPSADSKIVAWGNTDVGGTVGDADIVDTVSGVYYILTQLAADTGLDPTTWVLAMHTDLFERLTAIWPCSYLTNQCAVTNASGERLNVTGNEQVTMRDQMRTGRFLWVRGERVPVIITRAIPQTAVGAGFSSDIYFIPLMSMGIKTTYLEAFDQSNPQINGYLNQLGGVGEYRSMNGGLYAVTLQKTVFCVEYFFAMQPRLVMRTPFLAARITDVNYALPGDLYGRSPYPGDAYYLNGGTYYHTPGAADSSPATNL